MQFDTASRSDKIDWYITTWIVDADGDFTIRRELWRNHAWMRYKRIDDNSLAFGIVESRKYPMLKDLYGIMHGRLVATLLTHFDNMILDIEVTSQLEKDMIYLIQMSKYCHTAAKQVYKKSL